LLLLQLVQHIVPLLVELLILFDVSVLHFFSLLSLLEEEFFSSFVQILLFQFNNSVFCHFSL